MSDSAAEPWDEPWKRETSFWRERYAELRRLNSGELFVTKIRMNGQDLDRFQDLYDMRGTVLPKGAAWSYHGIPIFLDESARYPTFELHFNRNVHALCEDNT